MQLKQRIKKIEEKLSESKKLSDVCQPCKARIDAESKFYDSLIKGDADQIEVSGIEVSGIELSENEISFVCGFCQKPFSTAVIQFYKNAQFILSKN